MTVLLPRQFDYALGRAFTKSVAQSADVPELDLDFSKVKFVYPLGTLIVGREIRHWVRVRGKKRLITRATGLSDSHPAHTYLEHIGFFDWVGLPKRNKIGAAQGSSTYVPVTRISREEVKFLPGGSSREFKVAVMDFAERIGAVLFSRSEQEGFRAVCYSFKEVIRNVFEHSGANKCIVLGQRWKDGAVEVAIIDEGIGIRSSLSAAIPSATDALALQQAVRPGVSRTMTLSNEQNVHGNSGFGLYVLSELGRCFGRFAVGSGTASLTIESSGRVQNVVSFHGTFVGLRLNKIPHSFSGVLDDIVQSGEDDALKAGISARASNDSKSGSLEELDSP